MLLKHYLKNISKYTRLTKEEERKIFMRIRNGDEEAKNELICANLKLVVNVAKRYANENFQLIDLVQEGNIGLMEAIDKFDLEKGTKFDTYAVWHVKRTIIRALGNKSRTIRIPVHVFEKYQKLKKIMDKGEVKTTNGADITNISKLSGFSEEKVKLIFSSFNEVYSLDAFVDNENTSGFLMEMVEDKSSVTPHDYIFRRERLEEINRILNNLDERENEIVKSYYGVSKEREYTLKELSDMFKLTKERIRQIKVTALSKLRNSKFSNDLRELQAA